MTQHTSKTNNSKTTWTLHLAGTTPAWTHFPLTHDIFAREFDSERDAERAQDRLDLYVPFEGRRVAMTSVVGPQLSNNFYSAWVLEVEVL